MTRSDGPRCAGCGVELVGRTRRARWCSGQCKMRVRRGAPLVGVAAPAGDQDDAGDIVGAVRSALVAVGRLDTVDGQLALLMARRFESGEGTGSALGGLSRELRNTMALALTGTASGVPDFLDELNRRRLRKMGRGDRS